MKRRFCNEGAVKIRDKETAGAEAENQLPRKLGLGKKVSARDLWVGRWKKTKRKVRVGLLQLSRRWHNLKVMLGLVGRVGPKKRKNCDPFFMF